MSNPVFNRIDQNIQRGGYASFDDRRSTATGRYGQQSPQDMSTASLRGLYERPSAGPVQRGRLTVDDVMMKSLGLFGLMLLTAAATWLLTAGAPARAMPLLIGSVVVTLVLGLVIAFKKTISVPLIVAYAALEGVLVGAVSMTFEMMWPGIVTTAVIATLCVFAGMFAGWKFGLIRVTDKSRRIFGLAIMGYLLFALVNFGAAIFGMNAGWGFFGQGSLLGIAVSVLAVGLASYSLAIDFDSIDRAVAAGVPEKTSWLLAHGLIVTLVWLYLELLRLFAHFRE